MIGEVNIFGLYMSPLLPCILAGVVVSKFLRDYLMKRKVYARVWHVPFFDMCLTIICSGILVYLVNIYSHFSV